MTELLVTIGVIAVVAGFAIPVVSRARAAAQSVSCVSNLRQIWLGFTQYAAANEHCLPDPFRSGASWEQLLRPYLSDPAAFQCPADHELGPSIGSSYDWRDTGRPDTTLAGRLLTDCNRGGVVMAFEALPGWHAARRMNAVTLDGAAQTMDDEGCLGDLRRAIRATVPLPPVPPP